MTSPGQEPHGDLDHEELVAYLDGELDEGAARALEARLQHDAGTRREAEALQKTWDLLDYLPRAEPSPSFTHRTLSRLSAQRRGAASAQLVRRRAWVAGVGWAAAVLCTTALGYGAATLLLARPQPVATEEPADVDQQLVRELRIIENKRLYDPIEDLEFLRALDAPDLFGDDS